MKKIFEQRKGELTTQQIITITILVVSFIVILFLLFRLNLGEETGKELCRNSVLLKSKSILPKDSVSLNCYRSYKCITYDGSCEGLNEPEVVKVETKEEIYQQLSDEMSDCWYMFGEGKVDYVGTSATKNNYCSICSQIAFDNSLSNVPGVENGEISKDELYSYLSTAKINGDLTYAEYLFRTKDIESLKQAGAQSGAGTFGKIPTGKQSFVVMGITSQVNSWVWYATAVGVGALGVLAITPAGLVSIGIGLLVVSGGIAGSGAIIENFEPEISAIIVNGTNIPNIFLSPTIIEADSERFKALNCEEILTLS